MGRNVGTPDKVVRYLIAVAAFAGGITLGGTIGLVLYAVAAIMVLTALIGWCPIYRLIGVSTCKIEKQAARAAQKSAA